MTKRIVLAVLTVLVGFNAGAAYQWYDSSTEYSWTYSVWAGKANLERSAVSPKPKGALAIPSSFGRYPVTSIGSEAFNGCSGLTSVTIPSSVTNIGSNAFINCGALTSFAVESDNPSFSTISGMLCTKDGTKLIAGVNGDVTIPTCVTSIEKHAFYGYTGLTSVTIPSGVTNIGSQAFVDCGALMSFVVDSDNPSYAAINGILCAKDGSRMIRGVNGDVTIPSGMSSIGNNVFDGCTGLMSVAIPSSVTNIGSFAFYNCSGLTSMTIPSSVASIEACAFASCTGLVSVTIPSSVTSIGSNAFYDCSGLTSVTIPASVTSIGSYAFHLCSGLMSFAVDPDNPSYRAINGLLCTKDGRTLIRGVNGNVTIPSGVTSIDKSAFHGCSGLTSVTIPSSVTSIGTYAFAGCDGLTSVVIPASVTGIALGAFRGCSGLASVTIPSSVTTIGYSLFERCSGLTSVTIPPSVTSIENHAFNGCSGLTSVTIPSSVTRIDSSAFYGCCGLKSVTFPSSVTTIGSFAFYNCSGLTSVMIPSKVTSIGLQAFSGCDMLCIVYVHEGDEKRVASMLSGAGMDVSQVRWVKVVEQEFNEIADWIGYGLPGMFAAKHGIAARVYQDLFEAKFGSDYAAAITMETGKIGQGGACLQVWDDYVAGTDPLDETSVFAASIKMVDGLPVVAWTPELAAEAAALRTYTTYGATAPDGAWTDVSTLSAAERQAAGYRFFKVKIGMK